MDDIDGHLRAAVRHFWHTRDRQAASQGARSGRKDAGLRAAVTGGRHLNGFVELCRQLLIDAGIPDANLFWSTKVELPGYFRPEKSWDLLAVVNGELLAVLEFKAQVGPSFGNNFNNRAEEVLGNATDLWAAYEEGAFAPSQSPWLGYLFILENCPQSQKPVGVSAPHFPVFEEFVGASYAKRYELLLVRLVRKRLYNAACLLLTSKKDTVTGECSFPCEELTFEKFTTSLFAHATAYAQMRGGRS